MPDLTALATAVAGLGLGLALIAAIGAQNAFVLRQGLRGEHVPTVVAACAVSDIVLITAGVAGAGALVDHVPEAVTAMRWAGAAFLVAYGVLAARRVLAPTALRAATDGTSARRPILLTALALTWLNPHVYIDTVLLLGSVAASHGEHRWWFGAGATLASVLWFTGLGTGARLLRPVFARPGAWRVLDASIAVLMVTLAATLVTGA